MSRKQWGIAAVISGGFCILFFIATFSTEISAPSLTAIDECNSGEKSPEELGYPGMSCEEIAAKNNTIDGWGSLFFFISCCVTGPFSIIALLVAAFKKDELTDVQLAAYSQETARLQTQLQQTQTNLSQAEMSFQQIQHAHQQAEVQFIQARSAQSTLAGDAAASHASRMRELEAAEQRARAEMDAARSAVENAEKARLESDAAAEQARMERLAAQGAKQELVQAAQNIAPQPTQPQAPQFNVNIVNKEYTDSVHQEEK
jgi:hypothetical protein